MPVPQYRFVCRPVITTGRSKRIVYCIFGLLKGSVNSLLRNKVRSRCVTDSELERFGRKLSWSDFEQFAWADHKIISISIASLGADIWTWDLPDMRQVCQLLDMMFRSHGSEARFQYFGYVWENGVCCSILHKITANCHVQIIVFGLLHYFGSLVGSDVWKGPSA